MDLTIIAIKIRPYRHAQCMRDLVRPKQLGFGTRTLMDLHTDKKLSQVPEAISSREVTCSQARVVIDSS
jgi:hypothetical protein